MKRFKLILFLAALTLGATEASAQFSITKVTPKEVDTEALKDSTKNLEIDNSYFSQSRVDAERRRIRKERNTITFTTVTGLGQTGFNDWSAGGNNTFSTRVGINFSHLYKKSKFNFAYTLEAAYGLNHIDKQTFKNEDMFRLNINPSWDLNKNWSYAGLIQFGSQFDRGFKSRTDSTLVSNFMSPGNLTLGLGFTYRHQKLPLTINISPLSGNMTFVKDSILREKYGVDPDKNVKATIGSALILNFSIPFAKEKLTYRTYLDVFTNYDDVTRVKFDNYLDIKVLKFMVFSVFCKTIFDSTVNFAENPDTDPFLRKVQFNYSANVALTYTFKNK